MIFLDCETAGGLTAPPVLIQYAVDDGPVELHQVFAEPAGKTLRLLEQFVEHEGGVCAYNVSFDWYQLQRLHNVLSLLPPDEPPTKESWLKVERQAIHGPCLKPQTALDLFLHARKGPMQTLMERDAVRIRRVPKALAQPLADVLQERVEFDEIYFARRKAGYRWQVVEDEERPEFPDVVLRFAAAGGLKPTARFLLGAETTDLPVPKEYLAKDKKLLWNPFNGRWQEHFEWHVEHWAQNEKARRYAMDDVELLRRLWHHWGCPSPGDDDSVLACQLASSRWRGYAIDTVLLQGILTEAQRAARTAPELNRPRHVVKELNRLREELSEFERAVRGLEQPVADSRTKPTLERLVRTASGTALGDYAERLIRARSRQKEADQCRKLLEVGRFHPDFKVIGALSGRMAGAGGLNAQGVSSRKKGSRIRDGFLMADGGLSCLDGGDFTSFQVVLAAAVWKDSALTQDLQQGKKFHALYGSAMYELDYDELLRRDDLYGRSKNAVFATLFGAHTQKLAETLALPIDKAEEGLEALRARYPGIGRAEDAMAEQFAPLCQPIPGGPVLWREPADYVESIFGFRRYFTLENSVCRALFELAEDPPDSLRSWERVERREGREQTAGGALRSALYGAAFSIQARNVRCAKNHAIQSPESTILKKLQRDLWDRFQPAGIHPWNLSLMPVHDELLVVHRGIVELSDAVQEIVASFKDQVPLIAMDWRSGLDSWGALK